MCAFGAEATNRPCIHTCATSPTIFSIAIKWDDVRNVTGLATGRCEASGSKGIVRRTAEFTNLKSSMTNPNERGSSLSQSVQAKQTLSNNWQNTTPKAKLASDAHQSEDPQSRATKMNATSVYMSSFHRTVAAKGACHLRSCIRLGSSDALDN